MANHTPDNIANAELLWDPGYDEYGQPFLRLKHHIAAGTEITIDYGPWFAYSRYRDSLGRSRRLHNDYAASAGTRPSKIV